MADPPTVAVPSGGPAFSLIHNQCDAALAPGGWLFLGASDPAIAEIVPCEVVMTGAGIAYRPATTATSVRGFTPPPDDSWLRGAGTATFDENDMPGLEWPASITATSLPAAEVAELEPAPGNAAYPHESYESAYDQGDYDAAVGSARTGGVSPSSSRLKVRKP